MTFLPDFKPPSEAPEEGLWFLFHDQSLLIHSERENGLIPQSPEAERLGVSNLERQFLGWLNGRPCFAAEWPKGKKVHPPFAFMRLRSLFTRLDEDALHAAGLGNQLVLWDKNHRYCGRCGVMTESKKDERAKRCPRCGLINYPRLSPAIIVAVLRDDKILLARSNRFPAAFYSVLAGFVEPGETLEDCVKREVLEEVGISVRNIRYFGSQPWPFPDSLMVAFTAEHGRGELKVDRSEISDADWFSADRLPVVPPRISIARQLIDWFVEQAF